MNYCILYNCKKKSLCSFGLCTWAISLFFYWIILNYKGSYARSSLNSICHFQMILMMLLTMIVTMKHCRCPRMKCCHICECRQPCYTAGIQVELMFSKWRKCLRSFEGVLLQVLSVWIVECVFHIPVRRSRWT